MFDQLGMSAGSVITSINKTPVNSIKDIDKALKASNQNGMLIISGKNSDGSSFNNVFQMQ